MIASGALKVLITGFGIFGFWPFNNNCFHIMWVSFEGCWGHILGIKFGTWRFLFGCFTLSTASPQHESKSLCLIKSWIKSWLAILDQVWVKSFKTWVGLHYSETLLPHSIESIFLSFWGLTRLSPNLHQNGYVKAWCTTNKPCIVYNRSKFWVTLGHF